MSKSLPRLVGLLCVCRHALSIVWGLSRFYIRTIPHDVDLSHRQLPCAFVIGGLEDAIIPVGYSQQGIQSFFSRL